ncbi:hypothetical protein HK098_008298 [Nowakowskiella sp. JEL0407]|nr:hypothetical protein HK098_008298 [Nowakowskiella sp. JEL0407]
MYTTNQLNFAVRTSSKTFQQPNPLFKLQSRSLFFDAKPKPPFPNSAKPIPETSTPPPPAPPTTPPDVIPAVPLDLTTNTPVTDPSSVTDHLSHSISAITKLGDLESLGICTTTFTKYGGMYIEFIHVYTGLPWYGTVLLTSVSIRLLFTYVFAMSQRNSIIQFNIKPELDYAMEESKRLRKAGDLAGANKMQMKVMQLYKKNGVKMLLPLIVQLFQAFVFISLFWAFWEVFEKAPGLADGGVWWFRDLGKPDPYYVLPVLSAVSILAIFLAGPKFGAPPTHIPSTFKQVMKVLTVVGIYFSSFFPAGINLFVFTNIMTTLSQNAIFNMGRIRTFFKIPPIEKRALMYSEKVNQWPVVRPLKITEARKLLKNESN